MYTSIFLNDFAVTNVVIGVRLIYLMTAQFVINISVNFCIRFLFSAAAIRQSVVMLLLLLIIIIIMEIGISRLLASTSISRRVHVPFIRSRIR